MNIRDIVCPRERARQIFLLNRVHQKTTREIAEENGYATKGSICRQLAEHVQLMKQDDLCLEICNRVAKGEPFNKISWDLQCSEGLVVAMAAEVEHG